MSDFLLAFLFVGIGLFLFSVACEMVRSRFRPKHGIKHGMVINAVTGRVKSQQRKVLR